MGTFSLEPRSGLCGAWLRLGRGWCIYVCYLGHIIIAANASSFCYTSRLKFRVPDGRCWTDNAKPRLGLHCSLPFWDSQVCMRFSELSPEICAGVMLVLVVLVVWSQRQADKCFLLPSQPWGWRQQVEYSISYIRPLPSKEILWWICFWIHIIIITQMKYIFVSYHVAYAWLLAGSGTHKVHVTYNMWTCQVS